MTGNGPWHRYLKRRGDHEGQCRATPQVGAVDIEAFAKNLARLVEEGGKALAAYMKPREEGQVQDGISDEITDMVKTLGQVAEYWLSDPQRAVELQPVSAAPISIYGPARSNGMAGEAGHRSRRLTRGPALHRSGMVVEPVLRLPQAGLSAQHQLGRPAGQGRRRSRSAYPAEGRVLRRQITNAISPSNFVLTNPELLRETLASNAENLVRGMHMLAEDIEAGGGNLKIRQSDPACSRSAATWRSRRARWCSRMS